MNNPLSETVHPDKRSGAKDVAEAPARKEAGRGLLGVSGLFAMLAVASCCSVPVMLLSLGLGMVWIGVLTAGIVLVFVALAAAFFLAYEKQNRACS